MRSSISVRLSELAAIPQAMADSVRPLCTQPSRARYVAFLSLMVHYTKYAGAELRIAATHAAHPALQRLFERLGAEEQYHYRLAESDLARLGSTLDAIPPSVLAYRAFWADSAVKESWTILGVLYALENVAQFLAADAQSGLESLGLSADQTRFVRVHLEADEAHGRAVSECVERFLEEHGQRILEGAQRGAELWIAMHVGALHASGETP